MVNGFPQPNYGNTPLTFQPPSRRTYVVSVWSLSVRPMELWVYTMKKVMLSMVIRRNIQCKYLWVLRGMKRSLSWRSTQLNSHGFWANDEARWRSHDLSRLHFASLVGAHTSSFSDCTAQPYRQYRMLAKKLSRYVAMMRAIESDDCSIGMR